MADSNWIDVEPVGVAEGATVDYERQVTVHPGLDALAKLFTPRTLLATDLADKAIGKIEVAECKICAALLRKKAGTLAVHARWHEAQRKR